MTEASVAAKAAEKSPAPVPPCRIDPANELFLRYAEMNFYGGRDNGAQRQNPAYPNPPIRMPADDDDDDGGGGDGGGDGERMTGYLRKRIDDIESGRAEMRTYTLDEYMRHLDEIWSA